MIMRRRINNTKIFSITKKNEKKYITFFVVSMKNFKNLKYYTFQKKHQFLFFAVSARMKMKKILKKKNQLKYPGLI